ncbi:synemin [Elgaria multicarinata webbii]|uniref:synemin n=1 Tax=Elgaria multicarinata webbii TaxID=159646 RepID=UPI002FCCD1FD
MQQAEWDEQSELRELNCRLWHYVSRVRDLEQENRRLAQELAALRGQERRVCRLQEQEDEAAELRLAVAELSRAKGEAELERDALRQELARLERLGAQSVELRRRRLEPELAQQRQQLERLRADCAALEALLERLLGEHGRLQEARRRQRRPAKLPALPAPPPPRAKTARVNRRDLEESYALVLSWSCDQSLERYDAELRALQELEGRLGRENLQKLRAHNEHSRRQLGELHRRCRELSALAERLERERLAQQEHQGAELGEYQMIIEALEEEKRYLTMSIAEYLKDYHELLQVKASLSLEIETYRALLEGENSQWILMWDEEHGRKLPQGVRNMLYEYSNRHSAYQQEKGKRTFPAIQNVDTRYKSPVTNIRSSAAYLSRTKTAGMQAAAPGKTLRRDAFRPSAATKKDGTCERTLTKQREIRTLSPPYLISRGSEVLQRTFPERKRGETVYFSKESTTGQKRTASPSISENVRTKVGISTFPSYSRISSSKETKHETTTEGTHTRVNEQIKDSKPRKEGNTTFLETSAVEKISEKLAGADRNVNFQKKTEIKGMDGKKHMMEEFKDNRKEDRFMSDKTPKEGSYVRLEERIRMDTPGKNLPADVKFGESHSFQRGVNVSMARQSKESSEIPARSEVHTHGQVSKNNNVEITLQDLKPFAGKQKNETASKLTREPNQDEVNEEESAKVGSFLTESIAENIVSDILKGFVQKSSDAKPPPDTKASIFEKKDISEDGKLKTEIIIQSTMEDELNVSDEFDLGSVLKKDVKKVLEESKGAVAKDVIEDIIKAGVKGMEGKGKRTVQVEIVEEPLGTTADERMEFSTPFEVEEAEDTLPGMSGHRYYGDEEKATTSAAVDLKQKQPSVIVSHVEEVPEGDDVVDEEKYFVSTPDEYPLGHEQDEGSLYGQIHIEEESTVKYSWQDEFLQGSQTRINESMGSPELIYDVMGGEASAFTSKEDAPQEQVAHAESIVIEKEIKIPPEFHESIKGLFSQESKDPKHQLKEALEKLEDTLPESVKQELSALTKESQGDSSSLEVDIKKVENTKKGGLVTIVAELNLSQTLDSDQFSTEFLGKGVADEIKLPTQSQSEGGFVEYWKQESESSGDGRNKIGIDVSSTPWTIEEVSSSGKLSSSDGMEYLSNEQVSHQGPGFKSVEANSREYEYPLQGSFDSNRHIRQIVVGPTEIRRTEHVLYEGPISETLDFGSGASADISQSIKEFNLGPEEIQTTEKIIYRGPVHKTVELSGSESPVQAQLSTDIRSSKHITLGSNQIVEEFVFEGPASDLSSINNREGLLQMKGPAETSRSIRHIQIDPKEIHTEQVVYEGPISGFMESSSAGDHILTEESLSHIRLGQKDTQLSDRVVYEESSHKTIGPDLCMEGLPDTNTTIRHIKLSPKEFVTEQIVFTGPTSKQHLEFGEPGQIFSSEGSIRHIKLGQKDVRSSEQVVYQGSVSESSGVSSSGEDVLEEGGLTEISRSMRHVRLSPSETATEEIVFHGPVSETFSLGTADLSPTDGPSENSKSVGHIKIGAKEASFTFQMDVTNVAGGAQEATIFVPNRKGADNYQLEGTVKEGQKDIGSEQRSETSTFNKTVQLQRMVDQRSVISDEKKIALLYLNENEGEEEDDGPWF